MIKSPHFDSAIALATQLNDVFARSFGLKSPFQYESVLPGEMYGFVSASALDNGTYQAHNAVEVQPMTLDALIVIGCKDGQEASQMKLAWLVNVSHVVGMIKKMPEFNGANGFFHDLNMSRRVEATLRQSTTPLQDSQDPHPKAKNGRSARAIHPWIVDISWEMTGMLNIPKGYYGEHIEYSEIDIQSTYVEIATR